MNVWRCKECKIPIQDGILCQSTVCLQRHRQRRGQQRKDGPAVTVLPTHGKDDKDCKLCKRGDGLDG